MNLKTLQSTSPWEWPDGAADVLLNTLRDPAEKPSRQSVAIHLACESDVMNDAIADALLVIARREDAPEELRGAAAIALGPALELASSDAFGDPEEEALTAQGFKNVQKTLQQMYVDATLPKLVRRRILEAAVRAPQEWHQQAVRGAYASNDDDWRLTAVFCMEFIAGFDQEILESLASSVPEIEHHAVRAAGNRELAEAWEHVEALLSNEDTDKALLLSAIEAAASIAPAQAGPILVEMAHSADEEIAEAAEVALILTESEEDQTFMDPDFFEDEEPEDEEPEDEEPEDEEPEDEEPLH